MASSYFESIGRGTDRPIVSSNQEAYAVEEPNLTDGINKEIDRLQKDKESLMDLWARQYNHMHEQQMKLPGDILKLTKTGSDTAKSIKKYQDFIAPIQEFHRQIDSAKNADIRFIEDKPKTLKQLASELDEDVRKEDELNGEILQSEADINTIAASERRQGNTTTASYLEEGPPDADGYPVRTKARDFYRSKSQVIEDWDIWEATAGGVMQVHIPGQYINGEPVYKHFDDVHIVEEARYIANAMMYHYLERNRDLVMGRMGRYKRDVVLEMITKLDTMMKNKIDNLAEAGNENAKRIRAEDLKDRLKSDPGYFIDYVNLYSGAVGGIGLAKQEAAKTVAGYVETGAFDRSTVEAILEHEFLGNDGQPHKIGDYWKPEARVMLKAVRDAEKKQADADQEIFEAKVNNRVNQVVTDWRAAKTPPTLDQRREMMQELAAEFKVSIDSNLLDPIKDAFTQSEVSDDQIDWDLKRRKARGESISVADIQGIDDPDLKEEWLGKVNEAGINTTRRDTFIIGKVNSKTLENDGNKDKTDTWRAYKDNATIAFNKAFAEAIANGASAEEAFTAGQDAVTDGLDIGGNDLSWSRWGRSVYGSDEVRNLGLAKSALAKDPGLLSSDKPWVGEEPHVKEALRYINGDVLNMPIYYRNFPQIKRLPNGKVATPINLMKHRLNSLGLLKGDEPLPEDKLPNNLQQLFHKPTPNKTLRVINTDEGENWLNNTVEDEEVRILMDQRLRSSAQRSQQYASLDNYSTLVEMPRELEEELVALTGPISKWNLPHNLQTDVAKVLVEELLMT